MRHDDRNQGSQEHQPGQPAQLPTLRAYRDVAAQCWMLDASHAADAAKVRALFGTDQLPTPFTLDANPVDVAEMLSRLNPGHRIIIEQASAAVVTDRDQTAAGLQLANAIAAAGYGPKGEHRP